MGERDKGRMDSILYTGKLSKPNKILGLGVGRSIARDQPCTFTSRGNTASTPHWVLTARCLVPSAQQTKRTYPNPDAKLILGMLERWLSR